uniref:Uncharacterized protein n=1 Tax=uncultured Desulfobacterium sp. TaxID=201089 RepID=E1YKH7_9BACT|nr:unknown protein [uncultured Desulfobacterium sp.]
MIDHDLFVIAAQRSNNRCKWSAAEFASELICLVRLFHFRLAKPVPTP